MCELYQAYADYADIMDLTENLVACIAQDVLSMRVVRYGDDEINLAPPWRRLTIRDALIQYAELDITEFPTAETMRSAAAAHGVEADDDATRGQVVEKLISELVEPKLIQPTFLMDYPIDFPGSLLAKRKQDDPDLTERFEAYAAGMELGNAFTELNDPDDQRRRMEEAVSESDGARLEVDHDFLLALEHGMTTDWRTRFRSGSPSYAPDECPTGARDDSFSASASAWRHRCSAVSSSAHNRNE